MPSSYQWRHRSLICSADSQLQVAACGVILLIPLGTVVSDDYHSFTMLFIAVTLYLRKDFFGLVVSGSHTVALSHGLVLKQNTVVGREGMPE